LADWLVEQGIGEDRAICLKDGAVIAARLDWPGRLAAGQIEDATLVSRKSGSARGTVRFASGEEALIDGLPRDSREGGAIRARVTRNAVAETGRFKLAHARPTQDSPRPTPSLLEGLQEEGHTARIVRHFPEGAWQELFSEAWDGAVAFDQGGLTISPTSAMTLIDIDGYLPPAALASAAIPAVAEAILRFDLGGSIGIDFPSLSDKADRRAIDEGLQHALADWPHQHTAMNGFGFIQLVARLERASILHRLHHDRAGAAARLILRQAESIAAPGALLITLHPAARAAIRPEWESELARRTGRELRWHTDPALALAGGFAQAVAP